jgi:hypothetical protein
MNAKQTDKLIEAAYYRNCQGTMINIMDISKIFAAGRAALAEDRDLDTAVRRAILTHAVQR